MITVLCANKRSIYHKIARCDVWTAARDALNCTGGNVVIAHPPCAMWGRLYKQSKKDNWTHDKMLAAHCVQLVSEFGGVLEQPADSKLWDYFSLPHPYYANCPGEKPMGFSFCLDQHIFGHRGIKKTWIWIKGIRPAQLPAFPVFRLLQTDLVPVCDMGRTERSATPPAFAEWLVDVARCITAAQVNTVDMEIQELAAKQAVPCLSVVSNLGTS